jgi:hypothetical protein
MQKQQYEVDGYAIYTDLVPKMISDINKEIDFLEQTLPIGEDVFDENGSGKIKQIQYLHKKVVNAMNY